MYIFFRHLPPVQIMTDGRRNAVAIVIKLHMGTTVFHPGAHPKAAPAFIVAD
jgi:hypothetical protein